jgi:ferrous iron transport protein B
MKGKICDVKPVSDSVSRWLAIKILEHDPEIIKKMGGIRSEEDTYEEEFAHGKYQFISEFIEDVVVSKDDGENNLTDKIDKVVTHNIFGLPIFLFIMALVFAFTFTVGNFLAGYFDLGFAFISDFIESVFVKMNVDEWVISLVVDGIIGGVGGILIFLPNIACLFLAISILEDSGYMSRVALLMDKLMKKIGLSGKAFIPMILGFGCSVPAIMTARTLEEEKQKIVTILITPFMSCSAKIPIYVLFSRVFFPGYEILISFSLYLLGALIAVIAAMGFKKFMLTEESSPLIMEFPEYKKPDPKTTLIFVWEKVKDYLQKAGTIIFFASIVLWFILEYNFTGKVEMTESFGASIGKLVAPVFAPLGFGNWQASLALIAGVMGKEIVVSSMAVIYSVTDNGFATALLSAGFTGVSAYAFMVFSLLYTPCIATLGVIKKETNSHKWAIFSLIYQLAIAWIVSFIIYQVVSLFV